MGGRPPDGERLPRPAPARATHDTYDRLPRLSLPVLIVGGTYDGQAPPASQQALHDAIPGSRLELFEGGHTSLQEDPRALPCVIDFLEAGGS